MIQTLHISPSQEIQCQLIYKLFETHMVPFLQYQHPSQNLHRMYNCRSWYPPNGVNKTKYLCSNCRISKTMCTIRSNIFNKRRLINENR